MDKASACGAEDCEFDSHRVHRLEGEVQEWFNCSLSKSDVSIYRDRGFESHPHRMINKNLVLVSGAIVFKEGRGKRRWFVVKQTGDEDEKWEIPKVPVRKTESSSRAAIRIMGEKGGMDAKILEEAGRAGGSTTINGEIVPQRHLYYLMMQVAAGEVLGFEDYKWLEYAKAVRKLSSKRERLMIRQARQELRKWQREQKNKEQ